MYNFIKNKFQQRKKFQNNIIYIELILNIYIYNLFYILNVILKNKIYSHRCAGLNLVFT